MVIISLMMISITLIGVATGRYPWHREGRLSFREYLKSGAPITLVRLTVGVLWLQLLG